MTTPIEQAHDAALGCEIARLTSACAELRESRNTALSEVDRLQHELDKAEQRTIAAEQEVKWLQCGGWIPCTERLPKDSEWVIVCDAHGWVTGAVFWQYSDEESQWDFGEDGDSTVPTHWQPLPEPPQPEPGAAADIATANIEIIRADGNPVMVYVNNRTRITAECEGSGKRWLRIDDVPDQSIEIKDWPAAADGEDGETTDAI